MADTQEYLFEKALVRYRTSGYLSLYGQDRKAIAGYQKDKREFEKYKKEILGRDKDC